MSTGTFPDELKIADIVPVFKKEDPKDKTNYRPISLLPLISKIFEKKNRIRKQEYASSFLLNKQNVCLRLTLCQLLRTVL